VVAVAAAGVACSGGGDKKAGPATTRATTTTTAPPLAPLTGLPVTDADTVGRPALTVKIENAPQARPQAGLEAADVVYEEVVEGGLTRFLAVFDSQDADLIGPVRSVRPTDPMVVWPLGGLFAYYGGTPKFRGLLHRAPVRDIGELAFGQAYKARAGHQVPHQIYTSTKALYRGARSSDRPPPPLFAFLPSGQAFTPVGALPIVHLTITLGARASVGYDWERATGTWKRSNDGSAHLVEGGVHLAPTNVIVQFVAYHDSPGDTDSVGEPVPVAQVVGSGDAWIFSGGRLLKGRWSKPAAATVTSYTDPAGTPVPLLPGRTWVELVPVGAPVVTR
jgi:hypothetical protein